MGLSLNYLMGAFHRHSIHLVVLAFIWIFITVASNAMASASIGNVLLIKGQVQSESEGGDKVLLAKGDEVFLKDKIRTAKDGYVVLKMSDGMKLTLRPDSELVLDDFNDQPGSENVVLELIKGGLRTISGSIGKTNPESFELRTAVATIGIRGTDFAVRLCEGHQAGTACSSQCAIEERQLSAHPRISSNPEYINGEKITGTLTQCEPLDDITDGLYVALYDGTVNVANKDEELDLSAVVAARVELNSSPECLIDLPNFIALDVYLGL